MVPGGTPVDVTILPLVIPLNLDGTVKKASDRQEILVDAIKCTSGDCFPVVPKAVVGEKPATKFPSSHR
jgi:hypothetical protein